jgi:hypothetical protein
MPSAQKYTDSFGENTLMLLAKGACRV